MATCNCHNPSRNCKECRGESLGMITTEQAKKLNDCLEGLLAKGTKMSEVKRVRVTNGEKWNWYKQGQAHEVIEHDNLYYEDICGKGWILKSDCEVISEQETECSMDVLINSMIEHIPENMCEQECGITHAMRNNGEADSFHDEWECVDCGKLVYVSRVGSPAPPKFWKVSDAQLDKTAGLLCGARKDVEDGYGRLALRKIDLALESIDDRMFTPLEKGE